jgi:hypothetical protein
MKEIRLFGMALLTVLFSVSFSACSSSSDDESGNNPLIGVWKSIQPSGYDSNVYVDVLTFKSDGSGITEYYNEKDGYDKTPETFKYTYTISTFTLDFGDGDPETYQYSISGNEMKTNRHGGSTYIKQ